MGKLRKIGIYIFSKQIKERVVTDRDRYFDGKAFYGLNYIISEIDKKKNEISYVSNMNINSVDYCLISITSYYDIFNLRKELKGKIITTKIIIGGAGIINLQSVYDIADIVVIGRGEGIINKIFDNENIKGVWYKKRDANISSLYPIRQASKLINIKGYEEKEVGCSNKCKFCQYGWKFKIMNNDNNYSGGYNNREDTINNLDFSLCNRRTAPRLNSAIDGFTENTRKKINKKITNEDITNKLFEIYDQKQSYFALKLYAIIGFSWEKKIELQEFFESVKKADKKSLKKLNIFLISTHFVPMPITPFEGESVNLYDFRDEVKRKKYKYKGESINVYYPYNQITGVITTIEHTLINRIKINQLPIFDKVLLSSKYRSLKSVQKIKVIDKYFSGIYSEKESKDICPEIIRTFKY